MALLLVGSAAYAHNLAYDPTNGPAAIHVPAYNNSGSALDQGDVVIWDIDASTGDDDFYVTTTTTAETSLVAGVVGSGGCAAASSCSIVVWGIAQCDTDAGGVGEMGPLCTSSTAGAGQACTNSDAAYGIASVAVVGAGQDDCFINP